MGSVIYYFILSPAKPPKTTAEPIQHRKPAREGIPFKSTFVKKRGPSPKAPKVITTENGERYIADEILIGFVVGTSEEEIKKWMEPYQLKIIAYHPSTGLAHLKLIENAPDILELIETLKQEGNPLIRYIEPNYVLTID